MSWLSEALNGVKRALTIPAAKRAEFNTILAGSPALLTAVNTLKDSLTTAIIHDAIPATADPVSAALGGMLIAIEMERMLPTPPTPDPSAPAAEAATPPADVPQTEPAPAFTTGGMELQTPDGGA